MDIYSISDMLEHDEALAMAHELDVELSVFCQTCKGAGKSVNFEAETFAPCVPCGGTGYRLTYNGWALLRFIEEFGHHPDASASGFEELQD